MGMKPSKSQGPHVLGFRNRLRHRATFLFALTSWYDPNWHPRCHGCGLESYKKALETHLKECCWLGKYYFWSQNSMISFILPWKNTQNWCKTLKWPGSHVWKSRNRLRRHTSSPFAFTGCYDPNEHPRYVGCGLESHRKFFQTSQSCVVELKIATFYKF